MTNVQKNEATKETMVNAFRNPIDVAIEKELTKREIIKDADFLNWVFSKDRLYFPHIDLKDEDINEEKVYNKENVLKLNIFIISIVFHYAKMNKIRATTEFFESPSHKCYYYLKYNNNYYRIGYGYFKTSIRYYIFCEKIDGVAKNKKYIEFTDIQNNNNTIFAENQNVTNLVELIYSLATEENIPLEIIKEATDKTIETLKVAI